MEAEGGLLEGSHCINSRPHHFLVQCDLGITWPFVSQLSFFQSGMMTDRQTDCSHLLWFLEQSAINWMLQQQKFVVSILEDRSLQTCCCQDWLLRDPEGWSVLDHIPRFRWFSDNLCVPWVCIASARFEFSNIFLADSISASFCPPSCSWALSLCACLCPNPFL